MRLLVRVRRREENPTCMSVCGTLHGSCEEECPRGESEPITSRKLSPSRCWTTPRRLDSLRWNLTNEQSSVFCRWGCRFGWVPVQWFWSAGSVWARTFPEVVHMQGASAEASRKPPWLQFYRPRPTLPMCGYFTCCVLHNQGALRSAFKIVRRRDHKGIVEKDSLSSPQFLFFLLSFYIFFFLYV